MHTGRFGQGPPGGGERVAAVVLVVLGVLITVVAVLHGTSTPSPITREEPTPLRSGAPTPAAEHRPARDTAGGAQLLGPHLPASEPVSLAVPGLGLRTPLTRLGLDPQGAL